jgi:hypothetical protein
VLVAPRKRPKKGVSSIDRPFSALFRRGGPTCTRAAGPRRQRVAGVVGGGRPRGLAAIAAVFGARRTPKTTEKGRFLDRSPLFGPFPAWRAYVHARRGPPPPARGGRDGGRTPPRFGGDRRGLCRLAVHQRGAKRGVFSIDRPFLIFFSRSGKCVPARRAAGRRWSLVEVMRDGTSQLSVAIGASLGARRVAKCGL